MSPSPPGHWPCLAHPGHTRASGWGSPGSPSPQRPALGPLSPSGSPGHPEGKTSDNRFPYFPPTPGPRPPHASCEHPYFFPSSPLGEGEFLGPQVVQGPTLLTFPTGVCRAAPRSPPHAALESAASHNPALFPHSTQHTNMVIFPTKRLPKTQEQPLWGEKGTGKGLGARLADSPSRCCWGIIGGG